MDKVNVFDILKEMNLADINNGTGSLSLSNTFVSGKTVKQGAIIEMGVEASLLADILFGKRRAVIMIIDNKAYDEAKERLQSPIKQKEG